MNIKLLLLLCSITLGISSCGTCRYSSKSKEKTTAFEIQKTPCFGKCQTYNMSVFTDGSVLFEGINFVDNIGLYTHQLTKAEYSNLCKAFKKAKWSKLQNEYINSSIADLPQTTITKFDKKSTKTIIGQYQIPEAFKQVEKHFVNIANKKEGWKSLYGQYKTSLVEPSNELIVTVVDSISIDKLIESYSSFGLKNIKRLAPDLNYWILGFDDQKINPAKFLYMLKQEELIKEVQFNRKLELR